MRIKQWVSLAASAGTVIAVVTALPAASAQAAAATVSIPVGANYMVNGVGVEGSRFYAPAGFTVHKGDTLSFQLKGFDTATLLPVGQSPDEWAAENVESPTGAYAFIIPDDESGAFQFNPKDAFPSDPSCGTASTPCAYDGKSVVNSGLPLGSSSFDVTVNGNPGDVFWVISFIHVGMAMRVTVVPDGTATTSQAEVNGYGVGQITQDRESAAALIPKLEKPTRHKTAGGAVVWDAYAGFDQDGYALDGMFPRTLHVKKGQTVRWHFSQLTTNVHSVTFPKSQAVARNANFPAVVCEGASGDTPPDAAPPGFCSTGPQNIELEVAGSSLARAGTGKWGGSGFVSSGIEGAGAPSVAPFDVKFTKASPRKGFTYACIVHGGMMTGAVIVS